MNDKRQHINKGKESGNVLLALFAAVAVIGTIGGSATVLMRGPLSTMSDVNQNTMTEGNIYTAAKMVLLDAENWTGGGDCDSDRVVEPRPWRTHADTPPTGGGFVPHEIGSMKRDTWGTQLGYCAWDHGSVVTDKETVTDDKGCDSYNLLTGTNKRDYPTVAVISAGPNGAFDSTCRDYVDTTPADGEADNPLFEPGGDDIYVVYSYAEAAQELPSLWKVDSPDIWSIEVEGTTPEIVARDAVEFTGNDVFAPTRIEMIGQLGLLLPDEIAFPSCTAGTNGQVRRNMGGASPILELCDFGAGGFQEISGTATGESGGGGGESGGGSNPGFGMGTGAGSNTNYGIVGPTSGLVAYWRMDETSGTTVFDGIGANNGTMGGSMDAADDSVAGIFNNALDFDGTDHEIIVADSDDTLDLQPDFTVSLWVKLDAVVAVKSLLLKNHGAAPWYSWGIDVNGSTQFQFYVVNAAGGAASVQWTASPSANTWYHIVAVKEGADLRLYANGEKVNENSNFTGVELDGDGDLKIGAYNNPIRLDGKLDDIRIYHRALSDGEIANLYHFTNYISQVNVAMTGTLGNTVSSTGWTTLLATDVAGSSAGIAFNLRDTYSLTDAPSAAVVASRQAAPSRAHLLFQTNDGSFLSTRMVNTTDQTGFVLDNNAGVTQETNIQIGEHYDPAWDNNYTPGLLVTGNDQLLNQLTYFGDSAADNASTMLLFSKMLKLQSSNATGGSISEYLRFESTPQITAFSNVEISDEDTSSGYRIERYDGTAGVVSNFDFVRNRGGSGAVNDGDRIGSILFRGTANTSGSNASIRAAVNGAVSAGDVPADLIFGVDATGDSTSDEGLRLNSAGDVGVGKSAPEAKFHLGGRLVSDEGVLIGSDSTCSTAVDSGTLAYNGGTYELCDGSSFNAIGGGGGGGGDVSSSCTPIPFDFYDRDDLTASTVYQSNTVMIGNVTGSCALTVSSDSAAMTIVKNGSDESGTIVSVSNGDRISIKMQTSASVAGHVTAHVSLGSHSDAIDFQTEGKIAFVTSSSYNGMLGGVTGADAKCQAVAEAAGLGGKFFAWISDDSDDSAPANRFTKYDGGYYRVTGTKIADDWADLTDGSLDATMGVNEVGGGVTSMAWTNTNSDGTRATVDSCLNWSDGGFSYSSTYGNTYTTNSQWTVYTTHGCFNSKRLYCFEQ